MLDTGADVNLIHQVVVDQFPPGCYRCKQIPLPKVSGVTGPHLNITQCICFTLTLAGTPFTVEAFVAQGMAFSADILLGYGTLARNEIIVVPHRGRFIVKDCEDVLLPSTFGKSDALNDSRYTCAPASPEVQDNSPKRCGQNDERQLTYRKDLCKAKLTQFCRLMPDQLTLATLSLGDNWNSTDSSQISNPVLYCITEPSTVCIPGISIDCSIHQPVNGQIQLFAYNNTDQPINLRKGTKLVNCSVLEGYLHVQNVPDFKLHVVDKVNTQSHSASVMVNQDVPNSESASTLKVIEPDMVNPVEFTKALPRLITLLNHYRCAVALPEEPLGRTHLITHHINLKPGVQPKYIPAYRIPHSQRATIDKSVKEMLDQGVIQESTSPWNSPLLLVPKQDGSWRPCVDFRQLNKVTVPDRYPLPVLGDLLKSLGHNKVFSTLDLLSGFWQVPLDD